jgi:hypothetical protein
MDVETAVTMHLVGDDRRLAALVAALLAEDADSRSAAKHAAGDGPGPGDDDDDEDDDRSGGDVGNIDPDDDEGYDDEDDDDDEEPLQVKAIT